LFVRGGARIGATLLRRSAFLCTKTAPRTWPSRAELEILDEVQKEHRHQDTWSLIDWMHERLPEWRDPGTTSTPIAPVDILQALEKSPSEVATIAEDARAATYFDELFAR